MPTPVRLGNGGVEWTGQVGDPFFIVRLDPRTMEWAYASDGRLPPGRRPVEAGFEYDGRPLYHAAALIDGKRVPGKVGTHLVGAGIPYGGVEHVRNYYQVL